MKKTPKWAPRFDDKLRQSKLTKIVPRMKSRGYKLYCIFEDVEVEHLDYYGVTLISGYSYQLKKKLMTQRDYLGTRWLKPKHVTLLRMQGKQVIEATSDAYENPPIDFVKI